MFGISHAIFSIREIKSAYPNQWVALAVSETDADGFAVSGEVIAHEDDERFIWSAVKLGDMERPVYVFYTGSRNRTPVAA